MSDNRSGGIRIERPELDSVVVVLTGEHDYATRGALEACIYSLVEQNDVVVADLSDTMFIDSTTLHVLVTADRSARKRGSVFRIQLGTSSAVERALALSGLLEHLDCASSRDDALRKNGVPSAELTPS